MPVARGGSYPNYSTNGSNFIPEIFSGKLVRKFYASTVFGAIANTDYEGEIKNQGDVVHIATVPDITISPYVIGAGLTRQKLNSQGVDLNIDQALYYSFEVNDVDKLQSHLELDKWSNESSEKMRNQVDKTILGGIYPDISAINSGLTAGAESAGYNLGTDAAPVSITKANVLDFIVDVGSCLDESNVPDGDGERFMVLPSWMCGHIKKSDLKDASITGDGESVMRNGRLGIIDRFTIYRSNNVAKVTTRFHPIAGHKSGLTFASQLIKNRMIPNPNDFGDLIEGMQVFGYEVINPTALAHMVVTKG